MIHHIPGAPCTPRTMSEASRRADASAHLERIKAAKCPPLQDRQPAPKGRALTALIVVAVGILAAALCVWSVPAVILGLTCAVIVALVALCIIGLAVSNATRAGAEDLNWMDGERPHIDP